MRRLVVGLYLVAALPLAAGPVEDLQALERAMDALFAIPLDLDWMPTDPNEDLNAWVSRKARMAAHRPHAFASPRRFRCAVIAPRRADGQTGRTDLRAAQWVFFDALSPDQRQALSDGRLVLLEAMPPEAERALLAAYGGAIWQSRESRVLPSASAWDRRDEEEFLRRTFTDAEWQQRIDRQQAAHRRSLLKAGLPSRLAVRMSIGCRVSLTDAEGKERGGISDALDPNALLSQTVWRLDAQGSLSAAAEPSRDALRQQFEDELDALPAGLETNLIVPSRAYTLAELAGRLSRLRPCAIDPAFAAERLYLSAGSWPMAGLMADMATASGLLWCRDRATGQLTLGLYPALPATERTAELPAEVRDGLLARVEAYDWPFELRQILPDGRTRARIAADRLSAEQRAWLVETAGTYRLFDGQARTVVQRLPADRFEGPNVVVAFDTSIRLTLVELFNPDGGDAYLAEFVHPVTWPTASLLP